MRKDVWHSLNIRDVFRNEIIAHTIIILRQHGKSDENIKEEILRDFSVTPEQVEEMLSKLIVHDRGNQTNT